MGEEEWDRSGEYVRDVNGKGTGNNSLQIETYFLKSTNYTATHRDETSLIVLGLI